MLALDARKSCNLLGLLPPSPHAKSRLLFRARLVALARHPNLARMMTLPGGAGMVPVPGGAARLSDLARGAPPFAGLALEHAVWVIVDVLGALRALHEVALDDGTFVHGAVSPRTILLGEPGNSQLIPLVNAHVMPGAAPEQLGYVAPELLLNRELDARADLFSVGVLLWEALAQRRLFATPSVDAVAGRLQGSPPAIIELPTGAEWATPLCEVAQRCLELDPANRYASALEVSNVIVAAVGPQLTRFDAASPTPSERRGPPPPPRPRPQRAHTPEGIVIDMATTLSVTAPSSFARRPRHRTLLVAAAATSMLAAAGWFLLRGVPIQAERGPAAAARLASLDSVAVTSRPASSTPAPAVIEGAPTAAAPAPSSAVTTVAPPQVVLPVRRKTVKRTHPAGADYGI